MLPVLFSQLSSPIWILAASAAFILGISKAGIKGIAIIIVTMMALAFGARESTGLLVPLLVVGDIFAVIYYNRHTRWSYIAKFLPWMLLGLLMGVLTGNEIPERTFKWVMVVVILASVIMMYWWDRRKSKDVPTHWAFGGFIGLLAGFTTMIGNLAGAFSNIYFLAMRLPKNEFIGTAAWLFLIINVVKLPFHYYIWETISAESLRINLYLVPPIMVGLFVGVRLVRLLQEGFYRKMILLLTAVGAVLILFR